MDFFTFKRQNFEIKLDPIKDIHSFYITDSLCEDDIISWANLILTQGIYSETIDEITALNTHDTSNAYGLFETAANELHAPIYTTISGARNVTRLAFEQCLAGNIFSMDIVCFLYHKTSSLFADNNRQIYVYDLIDLNDLVDAVDVVEYEANHGTYKPNNKERLQYNQTLHPIMKTWLNKLAPDQTSVPVRD